MSAFLVLLFISKVTAAYYSSESLNSIYLNIKSYCHDREDIEGYLVTLADQNFYWLNKYS